MRHGECTSTRWHRCRVTIGNISQGMWASNKRRQQEESTIVLETLVVDCTHWPWLMDVSQWTLIVGCPHQLWLLHISQSLSNVDYSYLSLPAHNGQLKSGIHTCNSFGVLWSIHTGHLTSDVGCPNCISNAKHVRWCWTWFATIDRSLHTLVCLRWMVLKIIIRRVHSLVCPSKTSPPDIVHIFHKLECWRQMWSTNIFIRVHKKFY